MRAAQPSAALETLADTLWVERHLVEFLLFKLVTAKLVLAADERRFVTQCLDEVERVLGGLRQAEARREQAVAAVAADWDMPAGGLSLALLAERAPQPMRGVFADHHDAFRTLTAEIEATAAENRRLASAALNHVRETLDHLTASTPGTTYTASGRPDVATTNPTRWDRVL